jgi:hypothetical protein
MRVPVNASSLRARLPHFVPFLLLGLFVFACHWLLLLNQGVFVDGWVFYGLYLNRDATELLRLCQEHGNPVVCYFHMGFWHAPDMILAYKLSAFLCILVSTLMVYVLARRVNVLGPSECFFLAAAFCSYTGYQMHVEIDVLHYTFCYAIFLVAVNLALTGLTARGTRAIGWRIASLAAFFYSFQTGSLLVFYFPFLFLVLLVAEWQRPDWTWPGLAKRALRSIDFVVLPFAFWFVRNTWLKPNGEWVDYNQPQLNPEQWLRLGKVFVENSIIAQFEAAWDAINLHYITGIVLAVAILAGRVSLGRARRRAKEMTGQAGALRAVEVPGWAMLLFALGLLALAIFPYVATGYYAMYTGFASRHALLIGLPVAVGLVALSRLFRSIFPPHLFALPAALLLCAFCLSTSLIYGEYQSRWIRDLSIMANLRDLPRDKFSPVRAFVVSDPGRIGPEGYRFYEYSGMFKLAWGAERWAAIGPSGSQKFEIALGDLENILKSIPLRRYSLSELPAKGCNAVPNITTYIPEDRHFELIRNYFLMRVLAPDTERSFLKKLTSLSISDLECPGSRGPRPGQ